MLNLPDPRLSFEYNGKLYLVWPRELDKDVQLPDGTLVRVTADGNTQFAKVTSVTKLEAASGNGITTAMELEKRVGGPPPGALS